MRWLCIGLLLGHELAEERVGSGLRGVLLLHLQGLSELLCAID